MPAAIPIADEVVSAMARAVACVGAIVMGVAIGKRGSGVSGDFAVRRAIFAAVLILAALAPACAEVRIRASPGGEVGPYLKLFTLLRQSGERVVIDGPCFSACTLVLSTIPASRICVTSRAVLGFHAPRWVDRQGRVYAATKETQMVTDTYPAPVRAWIKRQGGLSSRLIYLRGRELAAMYPRCR
jgi:hypothetical protein